MFTEKGPGHGQRELTELMTKYVKQLVALPDHIVQCSHMTRFLQNKSSEKEVRSPLTVRGITLQLQDVMISFVAVPKLHPMGSKRFCAFVSKGCAHGGYRFWMLGTT